MKNYVLEQFICEKLDSLGIRNHTILVWNLMFKGFFVFHRFYCKELARQNNHIVNVEDAFMHMWILSDPLIRMQDPKYKEEKDPFLSGELNADDITVQSFFIKE